MSYHDKLFIQAMNEALFQLARVSGQPVSDKELIDDLRRVAHLLNSTAVSQAQYREHGKYAGTTVGRRFDSWNKAILAAGLSLSNEVDISDERLFENLQPTVSELQDLTGSSQAMVSQQLAVLRGTGVVTARREGPWVRYTISDERARRIMGCLRDTETS